MIERVIENWLDSTTEREYQFAFCQALAAQGFRIEHISSHGQMEQGKDIIATDRAGFHYAYQLKTGDIDQGTWRAIRGEIEELVELPIQHPNIPQASPFQPILVTTGTLTDPVRREITDRRIVWERNGHNALTVVTKWQLHDMLVKAQGNFLPRSPADFERFLKLFLGDKRNVLNKQEFSEFLQSLQPVGDIKRAELRRIFSATALLASYILSGFQREQNNFALAEGWILVVAYLLRLAERVKLYEPIWLPSILLCIEAWEQAAAALTAEAVERQWWVEGNPAVDVDILGFRTTILLGFLSAFALYCRAAKHPSKLENEIFGKIISRLKDSKYWGESATPHYYSVILLLFIHGKEGMAVQLTSEIIQLITNRNSNRAEQGIPDPYYEPEHLLEAAVGLEEIFGPKQSFVGSSFSLRSLVEFLARRERKQILKSLWHRITGIMSREFMPSPLEDTYLWRAKHGTLATALFGQPQDWSELKESAEKKPEINLLLYSRFPQLILPFLITYPHRFTPDLSRLAEMTAIS